MIKKIQIIFLGLVILSIGCTSTGIQTNSNADGSNNTPSGNAAQTTAASFAAAEVLTNLFALGSDFPPAIVIPDIPGMSGTAFVVTFSPPAVVPLDLATTPPAVSEAFPLFDASAIPEAAFPNNLWIESATRAYLLSATSVIVFNPTTGQKLSSVSLIAPINLTTPLAYSQPGDCDGNGAPESSVGPGPFFPSFPASLAVHSGRLFVTMSNSCFDASFESFYVQGILLVFDVQAGPPYLKIADTPFLVLPGFNASGITALSDRLIVTSTGDTSLQGGDNIPQSDSYLAQINPLTLAITNLLNLGMVAANFQPLAVNEAETRAYIGSAAFSEVYEINPSTFQILRGETNPIVLYGGNDYISDQVLTFGEEVLMVSSFNHSTVRAIDLTANPLTALGAELDFAFPENPGVTGAGPMALRPGQPGVDFGGPDLWVLTGSPGTVSAATTY
jgi:hypothetical protein